MTALTLDLFRPSILDPVEDAAGPTARAGLRARPRGSARQPARRRRRGTRTREPRPAGRRADPRRPGRRGLGGPVRPPHRRVPGLRRGDDAPLQRRARAGRRPLPRLRHDDGVDVLTSRDLHRPPTRRAAPPRRLARCTGATRVELLVMRAAARPTQSPLDGRGQRPWRAPSSRPSAGAPTRCTPGDWRDGPGVDRQSDGAHCMWPSACAAHPSSARSSARRWRSVEMARLAHHRRSLLRSCAANSRAFSASARWPSPTLRLGAARRTAAARRESRRGKSGHHRAWWSAQADPGKAAGKCHRDIPPMAGPHVRPAQARVKRCGKSAPASWRRGGQANPTRCKAKQDRLQAARRGPGRPLDGWSSTTRSGLQACYGEGPLRRALASCPASHAARSRGALLDPLRAPAAAAVGRAAPSTGCCTRRSSRSSSPTASASTPSGRPSTTSWRSTRTRRRARRLPRRAASQRTQRIRLGLGDPAAAARLPAPRARRRDGRDARPRLRRPRRARHGRDARPAPSSAASASTARPRARSGTRRSASSPG